jgi:hypothetical protein
LELVLQNGKTYIRKTVLVPFDTPPTMMDYEVPPPLASLPDARIRTPDEPIYIAPHGGGLGDQLLFSTLPEMFYRQVGSREIYILASDDTARNNPTVQKFCWERNPFVKRVIPYYEARKIEANTASLRVVDGHRYHSHLVARRYQNNVMAVEAMNGLFPTNEVPRIYYQPRFREEFAGKIFGDARCHSTPLPAAAYTNFVQYCGKLYGFDPTDIFMLESKYSGRAGADACPDQPRIEINSLEDYADLIYSCRFFCGVDSGSAALASAVKGHNFYPEVAVLQSNPLHSDRQWVWSNLQYHMTGKAMKHDFHL